MRVSSTPATACTLRQTPSPTRNGPRRMPAVPQAQLDAPPRIAVAVLEVQRAWLSTVTLASAEPALARRPRSSPVACACQRRDRRLPALHHPGGDGGGGQRHLPLRHRGARTRAPRQPSRGVRIAGADGVEHAWWPTATCSPGGGYSRARRQPRAGPASVSGGGYSLTVPLVDAARALGVHRARRDLQGRGDAFDEHPASAAWPARRLRPAPEPAPARDPGAGGGTGPLPRWRRRQGGGVPGPACAR